MIDQWEILNQFAERDELPSNITCGNDDDLDEPYISENSDSNNSEVRIHKYKHKLIRSYMNTYKYNYI